MNKSSWYLLTRKWTTAFSGQKLAIQSNQCHTEIDINHCSGASLTMQPYLMPFSMLLRFFFLVSATTKSTSNLSNEPFQWRQMSGPSFDASNMVNWTKRIETSWLRLISHSLFIFWLFKEISYLMEMNRALNDVCQENCTPSSVLHRANNEQSQEFWSRCVYVPN